MKKIFLEVNCPWRHEERYKNTKYFNWTNNFEETIDGIFFFDDAVYEGINLKTKIKKYGWLCESRSITPQIINKVKNNPDLFLQNYDIIFTHEREICNLNNKFKFVQNPSAVTWIKEPKIYSKNKLVSMISSNKTYCEGHRNRLEIANKLKDQLDLYGRGIKDINCKEEGLNDYMFSIVIENDSYETYFTEKILDCFACGTIPIYKGSPDITKYFNKDGIIFYNENFSIKDINEKLYISKKLAIEDNLKRVKNLTLAEDSLYEQYFMD